MPGFFFPSRPWIIHMVKGGNLENTQSLNVRESVAGSAPWSRYPPPPKWMGSSPTHTASFHQVLWKSVVFAASCLQINQPTNKQTGGKMYYLHQGSNTHVWAKGERPSREQTGRVTQRRDMERGKESLLSSSSWPYCVRLGAAKQTASSLWWRDFPLNYTRLGEVQWTVTNTKPVHCTQ